jgi:hypothetical protein
MIVKIGERVVGYGLVIPLMYLTVLYVIVHSERKEALRWRKDRCLDTGTILISSANSSCIQHSSI